MAEKSKIGSSAEILKEEIVMTAPNESPIIFRDIETISEMRAVEELQMHAWGDDPRDIVPVSQLAAARHVGGSLIGAFAGETLGGFVYGFYGRLGSSIIHHSHMLAVHNAYRNRDLAFRLKLAQREHVLKEGITDRITWTFDPLQSLNAYFNFAKLGVISDVYKVNAYGEAGTSFLHQNGTDRFFVTWLLNSSRVKGRIDRRSAGSPDERISSSDAVPLIRCDESNSPQRMADIGHIDRIESALVEIPTSISSIEKADFSTARKWRNETREVFTETLNAGFVVTDFFRKNERAGVYLLQKRRLEDM